MGETSSSKTILIFLLLVIVIPGVSLVSNRLWGGGPEKPPEPRSWVIQEGMTVGEFGKANQLPNSALKEVFGLQAGSDLQKRLAEYGAPEQIKSLLRKKLALAAEHASKNWVKIPVKFALWFAFLIGVFVLLKKRKVGPPLRKGLLLASVLIFGVIMGSDPSPMGTVKDALLLYGSAGAIFPPRMIALAVFLVIVFLANKYICAWGCQAGVLQDLIFRLNHTDAGRAALGKTFKPAFVLTNSVRVAFLLLFTVVAFMWGADVLEPLDPFRVYKPAHLGFGAAAFVGAVLIASLFVYRPWCHFFCPFGLVGWLVEKISRVRISVNYETCIACGKCAAACPSTVMGAILRRDRKTIPDCFACYTCRDVCPTGSIDFSSRKRTMPPAGR
jgi:NAD-dependent dihydropyrimidine dehydrogenase PreA subunit